jgi:hypothetical protein
MDAAYFHLYGIERDDVAYVMDTFPIVHRKDEATYGEYRTKRVMALGSSEKQGEVVELVVALGDENANIRWLAGSSLVRLRGQGVKALLFAYLATDPGEPDQSEGRRILDLIEEVSE